MHITKTGRITLFLFTQNYFACFDSQPAQYRIERGIDPCRSLSPPFRSVSEKIILIQGVSMYLKKRRSGHSPLVGLCPLVFNVLFCSRMHESELEIARESYAVAYVTGTCVLCRSLDRFTHFDCGLAACATVVLYDYCLTFGIEVSSHVTFISIPKHT